MQRAAVTHFLMCGRPDLPYGFVCFSVKAQVSSEGIFETQGHLYCFPLHIVSSFSLSAFALLRLILPSHAKAFCFNLYPDEWMGMC